MPKRENFKTARHVAQLRQGRNEWYRIENNAGSDVATVYVFDEIGYFGVTASDFIRDLSAITATSVDLHLSSPGGCVYDGFAIFEALRTHRARVTVHIDSLAASIASVIAMAGDRIIIGKFSEMMIHEASTVAIGNAAELREIAEHLDRESDRIAGVYAERAGGTVKQWRARMASETWYSAAEAVEAGLADEVAKPVRQDDQDLAARWDLSVFAHAGRAAAPAPDLSRPEPPAPVAPVPVPEVVDAVEPPTPPEPVAEPVVIDPDVFRAAMRSAAGEFTFDPAAFKQALTSLATDAPAVPAPSPEPVPELVAAVEPEPEPEPGMGEVLREVVATLSANAPAVPAPVAVDPEPVPPPEPVPAPEPPRDPWLDLAEVFRAGVELASGDAPSPAVSPAVEPEPDPYDPCVVSRALKEAIKQ